MGKGKSNKIRDLLGISQAELNKLREYLNMRLKWDVPNVILLDAIEQANRVGMIDAIKDQDILLDFIRKNYSSKSRVTHNSSSTTDKTSPRKKKAPVASRLQGILDRGGITQWDARTFIRLVRNQVGNRLRSEEDMISAVYYLSRQKIKITPISVSNRIIDRYANSYQPTIREISIPMGGSNKPRDPM